MKRLTIAIHEDTKVRIQQMKLDWRCKNEEEVVNILMDFYEENGDPLMFEAMELIRKIRNNEILQK